MLEKIYILSFIALLLYVKMYFTFSIRLTILNIVTMILGWSRKSCALMG